MHDIDNQNKENLLANNDQALLEGATEIILAGKRYMLRRPEVREIFKLTRLIGEIGARVGNDLLAKGAEAMATNNAGLGLQFLMSLAKESDKLIGFFANFAGLSQEEFMGLPAIALVELMEAIIQQQDFRDFFPTLARIKQNILTMQSLWQIS